jgi:hypothetical protein
MKKLTLIILSFLLFSCSKDLFEKDTVTANSRFKAIGKKYNENSQLLNQLYVYDNLQADYNSNPTEILPDFSFFNLSYNSFYADSEGITSSGYDNSSRNTNVYHKSFDSGNQFLSKNFTVQGRLFYSMHNSKKVYAFFERDYLDGNVSGEYVLKMVDLENGEEKVVELGNFSNIFDQFIRFVHTKESLFIYLGEHPSSTNPKSHLIVLSLINDTIIENKSDILYDVYNLVPDNLGNCYLFGRQNNFKYDLNSGSVIKIDNIPGPNSFLYDVYPSPGSPQIIIDNKFYFGLGGASPGPAAVYPSIYDLMTGEVETINIYDDITQFDDDEVGWNPQAKCFTMDYQNKIFLIGVTSANLGGSYRSHGVFKVDFEGKILEKQKIPIFPVDIIN